MEKELPIPYYLQVAETIRSRILANHYSQGDLIPSYRELEKEFNVSNITVRKAAAILVQDGLINHRKGIGTEVSKIDEDNITWELTAIFRASEILMIKFLLPLKYLKSRKWPARFR